MAVIKAVGSRLVFWPGTQVPIDKSTALMSVWSTGYKTRITAHDSVQLVVSIFENQSLQARSTRRSGHFNSVTAQPMLNQSSLWQPLPVEYHFSRLLDFWRKEDLCLSKLPLHCIQKGRAIEAFTVRTSKRDLEEKGIFQNATVLCLISNIIS